MAAKKKNEEEEDGKKKNQLGALLKEYKEEHLNYTDKVNWKCSTGSLLLDAATGMVSPGLWRLTGNNNSGKTPQTLEIVRNFLETVPNSKCLWVIAEGRGLSEENVARCGLKFVEDAEQWEIGTVFVLYSNIFELFIAAVKELVKENPDEIRYAFVVDSVDGLTLRDDAKKEVTENNRVAGIPALAKKMMQSLSLGMFRFGHWMGFISQVTAEIKLDQYAKTPDRGGNYSGGNSLLHAANIILNYGSSYAGDFILDNPNGKLNDGKSKPIGQEVRVEIGKALKEASKKQRLTYPIKYGRKPSGIWVEREVGDLVLAWGLAVKAGSWINFAEGTLIDLRRVEPDFPEKVQGLDKFYKVFEEYPKATKDLRDQFLVILSGATT